MINNSNSEGFDFRRYELITVILLILLISVGLLGCILSSASVQEIKTMRNSAIKIRNTLSSNTSVFSNVDKIYLGEALDEDLLSDVKSPVSRGNCSSSESYIEMIDGTYLITLRCGNYMIGEASFTGSDEGTFYKVSNWSVKKSKNSNDKEVLYNCLANGKEKYSDYYEEDYFLYNINKDYQKNYSSVKEIGKSTCKVVSKTFYREKVVYEH